MVSLPECGASTAKYVRKLLNDNGLDYQERVDHNNTSLHFIRDNLIVEMINHGKSYREVGGQFGLSHSRIAQIYMEHRDLLDDH